MNEKLIQELHHWHNSDKHHKIIQTVEALPESELSYELKSILGRAYNNESNYKKALEILLSESSKGTDDALWNFRVGYAYYYNDEPATALPYFQKSASLGDTTAKDFEKWCIRDTQQETQHISESTQKMTLNNIAWSFSKKFYTNSDEFNEAVADYQKRIYNNDARWKPHDIVFDFPVLQIQYEAWIRKRSDLLENETLTDDDKTIFETYPNEEQYQVEIVAELKATNGKNFTALEFLLKTHNQQANKELGDHVFFEGTDENPNTMNGLPTCYIACGS